VPDPVVSSSDAELRAHVERILSGNYELDREIGRGGMGIVYKAKDSRLKRPVAIKVLPPELSFRSDIRSRFLREAETAAQLSHPSIVPIYSVDERDGLVFFVMAFVDGENLAARLHRDGPFTPDETRRIVTDVAGALAYAHEHGVVHRDIKPDNILIENDGRVMVTDFGIARAVSDGDGSRLTATGMAIGTPAYMSPEQSMGEREIDGRSDLYALGVVAYQMLSGELPFNAPSTAAMLVKHISERPTPIDTKRAGIPSDLSRAVMLLLEKDPANRFPSAEALVQALETGQVPELRTRPSDAMSVGMPLESRLTYGEPSRPISAEGEVYGAPTSDDLARWDHRDVVKFRRKIAPWLAFGVASITLGVFRIIDFDLVGVWGLWTIYIAFQYAKLWTDGHDWRDVMKEPKDRMLFDVVAEWVDNVRAMWDPRKRAEVRERDRLRARSRASVVSARVTDTGSQVSGARGGQLSAVAASLTGPNARRVRVAAAQRDEIRSLLESLPRHDREQIADVPATANALYDRIESMANSIAELDRSITPGQSESVELEIQRLEAEANPLDQGSESRIRRLAQLKRQRRAIAQLGERREKLAAKLESCALALQNLQLDVLRLKTSGQGLGQITLIAERAMSVAQDVDGVVMASDELSRSRSGRTAERRASR
jgi:serine/threonine-protein kinase